MSARQRRDRNVPTSALDYGESATRRRSESFARPNVHDTFMSPISSRQHLRKGPPHLGLLQVAHSHIVHAQTGDAPTKIAYAGSPVSKTVAYINSAAIEPGASWLGANDIGAQSYGRWTVNAGETARIVPRLIFDYAPGRRPDPELEAQVRRAFKLWTRHLTGSAGTNSVHGQRLSRWGIRARVEGIRTRLPAYGTPQTRPTRMASRSCRYPQLKPRWSPAPTVRSPCCRRLLTKPGTLSDTGIP